VTLFWRLLLAFGAVATLSTAGLGLVLRQDRQASETERFDREVRTACTRAADEVKVQAERDQKIVGAACATGELVDRTLLAIEADDLDGRRTGLAALIPSEREAFGLDGLLLVAGGEVLGADPRELLGTPRADVTRLLGGDAARFVDATGAAASAPALVSRCSRGGKKIRVGLVGRRRIDPLLEHVGATMGVEVKRGDAQSDASFAAASCDVDDGASRVRISVRKSKAELDANLRRIDERVVLATGASLAVALVLALLLARSLGRPIAELAAEARKVASGEARPVRVRGPGEIAELSSAFDKMLEDLEATRRRLAATTRVAAWREVARSVAHEVKNPLAPIRAAVETLRRLRAREDPAFDEYFDEATRTVLSEVHRISNIVTEFTRFARLPPPRPTEVDVVDLVRGVVKLHETSEHGARLRLDARTEVPAVRCDRDQIVQVVTNLVQNALDAVGPKPGAEVRVSVERPDADHVAVVVRDDGPGVAPELRERLFEPYATNKAQGTGLGLAIAQRIAMEHQGELSYRPSPAGGAEFHLVLPVEGPPPVSEMAPPSSG
jgi:signal transduction histidine kinase